MTEFNYLSESHRQHFRDVKVDEIKFPLYAEDKWDGEYINIFIGKDGNVKLANRRKSVYDATTYIRADLPKIECILEGEYISLRGDLYCFLSDRVKLNCKDLAVRIFGIISLSGKDVRSLDYEERWKILERLIPENSKYVQLVRHKKVFSKEEAEIFYQEALDSGREGIILKSLFSHHRNGYKVKPKITLDVVIMGFEKTKSWLVHGFPNCFLLGILKNGKWERFGKTSSGLTEPEKRALVEILLENKIGEDSKFVYCKPSVILEIQFQEKLKNGFRHPKILKWKSSLSPKYAQQIKLDEIPKIKVVRRREDKDITQVTPAIEIEEIINKVVRG